MSVKHCCTKHFRREMYALQHEFTSDFYLSCWQKNRAVLPLFCIRALLFLGCLAILITSLVMWDVGSFGHFFIYLTHWGVILITLATGAACAVSARAYYKRPIEGIFGLPWYVKTYWALVNAATTIAFFITVFYFSFLTGESEKYAMNKTLDFFIHGANSIIMFVLLMISRHPMRLQHVYFPIIFGVVYLIFNVIYYVAGGLSPFGDTVWIYPMLDWNETGVAVLCSIGSAAAIVITHIVVFALAKLRDYMSTKYTRSSMSMSIANL